jgi:hypothetical protein
MQGLFDELAGLDVVDSRAFSDRQLGSVTDFEAIDIEPGVQAVVVGWVLDLNFYTICYASKCL